MTNLAAYDSTDKKWAVKCLNETLCLILSSMLAESLVLQNRQLQNMTEQKVKA
jgi:hypothetical protein